MRIGVLRAERLRLIRTVAIVAVAALGAGCSADISRFDDGFYTGAVPQKPTPQGNVGMAQAYPGSLDRTSTGSVGGGRQPLYDGASGSLPPPPSQQYARNYPAGGVREGGVQRSMLAPPSDAPRAYAPPAQSTRSMPVETAEAAPRQAVRNGWNAGPAPAAERGGEPIGAAPKAPSANRVASTPGHVVVESGDSLIGIARRSGVSVAELKAANGMTEDTVRIGQKLTLPGGAAEPKRVASLDPKAGLETKSVVKPAAKAVAETAEKQPKPYQPPQQKAAVQPQSAAETKPAAPQAKSVASAAPVAPAKEDAAPAAKQEAPATTIADEEEKDTASAPSSTGIDQFRWPVQGRVVKRFGEKEGSRRSDGLDISVPRGTPVKAAENGVVIYAGDGLKEFGNTVLVRHDNGLVTVYGHADALNVKRGETVKRGQQLATSGMSGDASTPMVHFEVRKNSAPVDPGKYLQ